MLERLKKALRGFLDIKPTEDLLALSDELHEAIMGLQDLTDEAARNLKELKAIKSAHDVVARASLLGGHPPVPMANPLDQNVLEMWNKVTSRDAVARQSLVDQEKNVEDYFMKILQGTLGDFFFELYKGDKQKVPGLDTEVMLFVDVRENGYGKRVRMRYHGKLVGDATFTTVLHGDHSHQQVDMHIKPKQ